MAIGLTVTPPNSRRGLFIRRPVSIDIVAFAYGAWLSGMMLIQFLMSGGQTSIIIGFSGVLIPAFLHVWLLGFARNNDKCGFALFAIFGILIAVSLLANIDRVTWDVVPQTLGLFVIAGLGYLLAQHSDQRLVERIFIWTAILLAAVLILVLIDNDRHWARLSGRLHSNLWAAVALVAVPGALALQNRFAAAVVSAFVIYMIGLEFNARGPLIYALSIVAAFVAVWAVLHPRKSLAPQTLATAITFVGIASFLVVANWDFITKDILMLDSATRGFGSGFTGRTDLWVYLIGVAADHPFTGVGFRMHEAFVSAPGLYSAHNAYIAILVDLGVFGLGIYLAMIAIALWRAVVRYRSPLVAAYLIGYILLGMTEGRALNVGNPASILFIISIMAMLSVRRRST